MTNNALLSLINAIDLMAMAENDNDERYVVGFLSDARFWIRKLNRENRIAGEDLLKEVVSGMVFNNARYGTMAQRLAFN